MKKFSSITKIFVFIVLVASLSSFSGCNTKVPEPGNIEKRPITLIMNNTYQGNKLVEFTHFKSVQNNTLWFTRMNYYLSNVVAVKQDGSSELISDITLYDLAIDGDKFRITGEIPIGDYKHIRFDLGVREDYNLKDPATYPSSHPLSINNNMYWGWSTQYIFSKIEGFEIENNDTASFVIHTGTQDLYRPNISIANAFAVTNAGGEVEIEMDLHSLLYQTEYDFNLTQDGQSHTVDNLSLAVQFMDNFTRAFK